ncbi:MAG TPA: cysteine--tRNA ligase [Caldilineae bacterium]|nr:cysteine--tRNA ligase [Caldilineae bacterium]HIQ11272.1 cysteine--tRNA ligase [Caldilineales bacterium]
MTLKVYNTLTRQKEVFEPLEPGVVRMYVCGPTVYADAHIGHAMSAIVFDVIRRYLEYKGYQVIHVMNFTDVDDKIINKARERGQDPFALANGYIEKFLEQMDALNVTRPTVMPRVSGTIDEIIAMVQDLIAKGYAYEVDGNVFFRVRKDEDYGKLSRRKLDETTRGERENFAEELKEDPLDFALWKAQKSPDEPAWESPWGLGRPGWHIECSAMVRKHLGPTIDIHGGGNDLIFPHHENEIAQSESCNDAPLAKYWLHNGMVVLSGEKMSKSLGNLVTIDEFLAEHDADVFRLLVLGSHYRKPLVYDDEVAAQAEKAHQRLLGALKPPVGGKTEGPEAEALLEAAEQAKGRFEAALDDDFNTAAALGHIFDLVKAINTARDAGVGGEPFEQAQATLTKLTGALGLRLQPKTTTGSDAAPFIDLLVEVRGELRKARQWDLADRIRDRLTELGVLLEDTREGTTWSWKNRK